MKISIIVPIYNAEEYLNKCIPSILNQTEKDIQLILVDDGSTDGSRRLCEDYAEGDSRILFLHQKNSGVSAARNLGISQASGKYIGFVDSDDWIEPEMFEYLLKEANQSDADVVMCDATTVYFDGKNQVDTITQLSENQILKKKDFTPSLLLEMAGSACRCIYKNDRYNDKIRKYLLAFPLGVKFSEDRIFNLYALGQANQVVYLKESFYNRYMNVDSTVHRFHYDYFEAYKKAAEEIRIAIQKVWENNSELQKAYLGQFIGGALGAVCNYYYKTSPLKNAEKRGMVKKLCEDSQLRIAIETYGADRRSCWILDRNYTALIWYARLANWRHGR